LDLIIDPSIDFTLTKPPRPAHLESRNFPVRGEPVKRPLADFQVGSQLVECEDRLLARCHTPPKKKVPSSRGLARGNSCKTLQDIAPNMPKVKSQHPATCWAIDVTPISREGVLGQSDPAIGKGLIGSLQVL
jgi:hypothetical protein